MRPVTLGVHRNLRTARRVRTSKQVELEAVMKTGWVVLVLTGLAVLWVATRGDEAHAGPGSLQQRRIGSKEYRKPDAEQLKKLTPMQLRVTQEEATEPPFKNEHWDNHEAGIFVDVTTGEPLFSSLDKFESGTGWPSFTRPIEGGRVREKKDTSWGSVRTEVRSQGGDAHLGHVFDDGPAPTGLRYCINSASLRFVPAGQLAEQGYAEYAALFAPAPVASGTNETAILAGGCFWGMEEILRSIPGVVSTEVGYTGGDASLGTYEDVHTGKTGHAESVRVVFDPKKLTYATLLEQWFFRMHDPTTPNRQGNDVGTQYRSAIFYASPEQQKVAQEVKARVDKGGKWKRPVVTEIVPAKPFIPAEGYHQDYLQKNPGGYTCHFMRD